MCRGDGKAKSLGFDGVEPVFPASLIIVLHRGDGFPCVSVKDRQLVIADAFLGNRAATPPRIDVGVECQQDFLEFYSLGERQFEGLRQRSSRIGDPFVPFQPDGAGETVDHVGGDSVLGRVDRWIEGDRVVLIFQHRPVRAAERPA